MPLLYGEEEKAFRRLQEEIIRSTADFSIFAWRMPSATSNTRVPNDRVFCGILAKAPIVFANCGLFVKKVDHERREFSVSNIGVKLKFGYFLSQSSEKNQKIQLATSYHLHALGPLNSPSE